MCGARRSPGSARKRVVTATLLADDTTRVLGAHEGVPSPMGSVLDDLSDAERTQLSERLGHVREVLTGYRSGSADLAGPGEPRPEFDPSLPQKGRYRAKAAELGVGLRTVERWVAAVREAGPIGLIDGRSVRPIDPLFGVDVRWVEMCRTVLAEHTEASRPTKQLLLDRVAARLEAEYGAEVVPVPGEKRARAVLAELVRGSERLPRSDETEAVDRGAAVRCLRPAAGDPAGRVPAVGHDPARRVCHGAAHVALGPAGADHRHGSVLPGDLRAAPVGGVDQGGGRRGGAVRDAHPGLDSQHRERTVALRRAARCGGRRRRDGRASPTSADAEAGMGCRGWRPRRWWSTTARSISPSICWRCANASASRSSRPGR